MLHTRLLNYLDVVARTGSIRKASAQLNVAASAISRQIMSLEEEIGTPLFHRLPRKLVLTAAGEVLIRHVRETLKDLERAQSKIEELKGLRRGEITVALMSGLAANLVARAASDFARAHARVRINLQLHPTGDSILSAVANMEADLGLAFDLASDVRIRVLNKVAGRLGAVMAPTHPLADRPILRLSDCAGYPLIVSDRSMVIRPYLQNAFARQSLDLTPAIETNSIEIMRRLAMDMPFLTFLTPFDIEFDRSAGRLAYVEIKELSKETQNLMLVTHDKGAGAVASVLAETMSTMMRGMAPAAGE